MPRVWIVTQGAHAVDASRVRAEQAPVWAMARAISLEQPDLPCACVDLDPAEGARAAAERLVGELSTTDDENEVAWRSGRRHVRRVVPAPAGGVLARFVADPRATYLVTGGLGYLGQKVASWLAARGARHLALVGRRTLDGPQDELRRIEALGCEVQRLAIDVVDGPRIRELVARLRASPAALKGVVHAAGVLDDGVLSDQTWSRFRAVMAAKVEGTFHLHEATRDAALDLFVCFSSMAAVLGAPAQSNYAAANAFQDAICHARRADGLPGVSVDWGPWAGGGMVATLSDGDQRRIASRGFRPTAPDRALAALESLVRGGPPQRLVLSVDWASLERAMPAGVLPPLLRAFATRRTPSPPRASIREELLAARPALRRGLLGRLVRAEVVQVLRGSSALELEDRKGLADVGLDSLQGVNLRNRLSAAIGAPLPFTLVLDNPTLEQLVEYVASTLPDLLMPAASAPPPGDDLESLSELELRVLLAEQLGAAGPSAGGGVDEA